MSNSKSDPSGRELLRSPVVFTVSSLVVAAVLGASGNLWSYLPRHWTATFSVPIAVVVAITALLMSIRSKYVFLSLSAALCILGAMFVDSVASIGYQTRLLAGVLLAQICLFAVVSLPRIVRPEKAVLWILATLVQSVWIHDVVTVGEHISFFGSTMVR